MNSGVYIIKNKVNGKVYVGSAVSIQKRWRKHKEDLRKGKHHSPHLQSSWDKHSEENFEFVVIEQCQPKNLIKLEQFMLDLLCSYERDKGYNICPTAGSWLGLKHSEEAKKKMKRNHKKSWLGKRHSEETKQKISELRNGAKNPFFGKTHTEETKQKISEYGKGKTHTEETKQKISESQKGKIISDEQRIKMSKNRRKPETCKGYYFHKTSGKFRATIRKMGKRKYLGLYNTPEEARAAYLEAVENISITDGGI